MGILHPNFNELSVVYQHLHFGPFSKPGSMAQIIIVKHNAKMQTFTMECHGNERLPNIGGVNGKYEQLDHNIKYQTTVHC
jgi:hypothetical protein